jgi:hypothetical protein
MGTQPRLKGKDWEAVLPLKWLKRHSLKEKPPPAVLLHALARDSSVKVENLFLTSPIGTNLYRGERLAISEAGGG